MSDKTFSRALSVLVGILIGWPLAAWAADWYEATGKPVQRGALNSADLRTEFASIEANIADKLPALTGNGGLLVRVNAGGTALEATSAGLTVAAGGTGATTLTGLLQGNGTSAITGISNSSTVGQALRVTGAATYAWGALDLADTDAVTGALAVVNGGTGASDAATARTNLGVTATGGDTAYAFRANNLSDLASAATARTNLGVTATGGDTTYAFRANNLSDLANASTARTNLGLAIGTNVQAFDADLTTLGALGSGARTALGLAIGTDVQAFDAQLADVAGLAVTDNNFIVGNGANFVAESGATARTSLGLGSLATLSTVNDGNWSGTALALGNGGTGAALVDPNADRILFWDDSGTAITFLTVGSGLQITGTSLESTSSGGTVTSVGGTGTVNGVTLTGTVTTSGNLTLGGTLSINNADWSGTDLSVANGGTGASTLTGLLQGNGTSAITGITNSSTAGQVLRVTGVSTYAWGALDLADGDAITGDLPDANLSANLTAIAGLAVTDNNVIVGNGSAWVAESGTTLRTSLGLAIGTDVQAFDAQLSDVAGLSVADNNFIVGNGSNFVAESSGTARTSLGLGALATLSSVNNGDWSGTDLAVANGGTGASDAATARSNLSAAGSATTISVSGTGLSGGGDLSANRTITIDQTAMTTRNISGKSGTTKTLSTSAPSGGSDGDIWYKY